MGAAILSVLRSTTRISSGQPLCQLHRAGAARAGGTLRRACEEDLAKGWGVHTFCQKVSEMSGGPHSRRQPCPRRRAAALPKRTFASPANTLYLRYTICVSSPALTLARCLPTSCACATLRFLLSRHWPRLWPLPPPLPPPPTRLPAPPRLQP
ncbi:hypothetical protein EON67_06490 [archaeon]|nr:MAG: hypothetical protein EON67_06490 [archaeon]